MAFEDKVREKISTTKTGAADPLTAEGTPFTAGGAPKPKKRVGSAGSGVSTGDLATKSWVESNMDALAVELSDKLDNFSPAVPRPIIVQAPDKREIGTIEGASHYQMEKVLRAAQVRDRHGRCKNLFLSGPTGSGKTTIGEQLAGVLNVEFFSIGQVEMPHELTGAVNPLTDVYRESIFVKALQRKCVLMLEEIDAWSPRATLVSNTALANGYMFLPNGEKIEKHPECLIIACANTWGSGATTDYVGRNKLDAAFLNRFGIRFSIEYDEDLERAFTANDLVCDAVQTIRYNAKKQGIKIIVSPRVSIDVADMVAGGFDLREALYMTCLADVTQDQRKRLLSDVAFT